MAMETITTLAGGMLCYRYVLDDDAARVIEGHLLAEIGVPYKERFREEMREQNWIVEYGRALDAAPFKADFVLCTADAAI
jgi:hypothetical protein